MKGTLKKSAIITAVCMAVLCISMYSEPTPEQIAERTELLCEAINSNNVEQAKVCIKLGANVNAKAYIYSNDHGNTFPTTNQNNYYPLCTTTLLNYAVAHETSKDIVELLIKAGADVNAKRNTDGWTALTVAAYSGHKDMAELLIKSGADVNAKSNNGNTVLLSVDYRNKDIKDIVELLIKAGADVNAKTDYGYTALLSVDYSKKDTKDIVELLIKAGADVNAKNKHGGTALMFAAHRNKDIVELLIKAGADVNAKDNDGRTALTSAASNNKEDIAEILIKAGANGEEALVRAVKFSSQDAVKFLIKLGVNPNVKDNEGISALDNALLNGRNDIANLLRAAGAKE